MAKVLLKRRSLEEIMDNRSIPVDAQKSQSKNCAVMIEKCAHSQRWGNLSLATTSYPLNKSASKKIVVGLFYNKNNKIFDAGIKILNMYYPDGLFLEPFTWSELQNCFDTIDRYFEIEEEAVPSKMTINDTEIIFIQTHGVKAILFDKVSVCTSNSECKKSRTFSPGVVMQKQTYFGLKDSVKCISERLHQLEKISSVVNKCKNHVLEEIIAIAKRQNLKNIMSETVLRDIICDYELEIKNIVETKISTFENHVFLDHYFEIVYLELITFCTTMLFEGMMELCGEN